MNIMENNTTQVNTVQNKSSKWVHASIVVAIVIVMNLFFNYAISLVFNEPEYNDYIKPSQVVESPVSKDACLKVGGQWSENVYPVESTKTKPQIEGYCNENYTNQLNYDKARANYEKKVFITLISLGIISLVVAGFIAIQILSIAFAWGGVLSLIIASVRYWSVADNIAKVIILAIALGLLIWLAIKKFNK